MGMNELRLSTMAMTAEQILEEARALSRRERLRIAEQLVREEADAAGDDLEDYPAECLMPETEEELDRELARRIERARAGHSSPADEVLARLRARRAAGA